MPNARHRQSATSVEKGEQQWDDSPVMLLLLLVLFLGGCLFYYSIEGTSQSLGQANFALLSAEGLTAEQVNQSIDRHLKEDDRTSYLRRLQVDLYNSQSRGATGPKVPLSVNDSLKYGVTLEQDDAGAQAIRELDQENFEDQDRFMSVEQAINARLERDRLVEENDQVAEKTFVREFIKRAEEAGLEVELNENLDVVNVRKIYQKEPLRFPQSTTNRGGK